jgi:hypothetical protein
MDCQEQVQVQDKLKSERVGEGLAADLKKERLEELLRRVPGWGLAPSRQAIDRARVFPDPGVAEAYAAFVTRLARSRRQAVTIDVGGSQVIVTIYGQVEEACIAGLSEAAFALAADIG